MRKLIGSLVFIAFFFLLLQPAWGHDTQLKGHQRRLGYVLGLDIGASLRNMTSHINIDSLMMGLKDGFKNNKQLISPTEARRLKQELANHNQLQKKEEIRAIGKKNLNKGLGFMASNKGKKGIITTASGLQYQIIKKGEGIKPTKEDYVVMKYKGVLLNGTEFHNSYKSSQTDTVQVNSLVPGLAEALELMPVGSRYKIYVPARLGYGYKGHGRQIPPFAVLSYDVTLIKLETNKEHLSTITEPKVKINFDDINLTTLDSAAFNVYSSYTSKLNPGTNKNEIMATCKMLAVLSYVSSCENFMNDRLRSIKSFVRADFQRPIKNIIKKYNSVTIAWRERLQKKDKTFTNRQKMLSIKFTKVGQYWKVSQLNIDKNI